MLTYFINNNLVSIFFKAFRESSASVASNIHILTYSYCVGVREKSFFYQIKKKHTGGNSVASRGSLRGLIGFSSGPYQSGGRPCLSFHLRCVRFPLARTRARWPRRNPTVEWGHDINYIYIRERLSSPLRQSLPLYSHTVRRSPFMLTTSSSTTLIYNAGLFIAPPSHHHRAQGTRNPETGSSIIH